MENLQQQLADMLDINTEATTEGTTEEATVDNNVEATPEAGTAEVSQDSTDTTEHSGDNSTIRQMREQISKQKSELDRYNNLLQRLANDKGISMEQLEEEITAREDNTRAKNIGVSPEVAKQLRMQEERIKQLEQQAIEEDFMHRVNVFKRETGLNDQETIKFMRDAQSKGLNPVNKGTDLTILYRAVNFDNIMKTKESEIRQQILQEMQQQREASSSITGTTGSTKTTSESKSVDNVSAEALMKDLFKKFNY